MVSIHDSVLIRGALPDVWAYLWDAERWPAITPHVKRIEVLDSGAGWQRLRMHVQSGDQLFQMETQRIGIEERSITYCQLTPPPILHEHQGVWTLSTEYEGVRVDLVHHVRINEERAREILGTSTSEETLEKVRGTLSRNGRTTLEAVKSHVEHPR